MSNFRLTWLISLALAGAALAADRAQPAQSAILLREIRDQIDASAPASVELYQRYFDAFPSSFAQLSEVLVSQTYSEIRDSAARQHHSGRALKFDDQGSPFSVAAQK